MQSKNLDYQKGQSDNLPTQERLGVTKPLVDKEDLISSQSNSSSMGVGKRKIEYVSSIVEFLRSNKKTILNDRSTTSNNCIQSIELYLTSGPESTSKDQGYVPFWNTRCKEISKSLWLPTKIVSQDFVSISLNGSSLGTMGGLSFKMKTEAKHTLQNLSLQKISSQLSQSSPAECKENEDTTKSVTNLKMMKVKVYPTKRQRRWFIQTQHNLRALRNAAIEQVNNKKIQVSELRSKMVSTDTRKNVVAASFPDGTSDEIAKHYLKWKAIDSTPATIRKNAMRKLMSEYNANFKALREGRRKKFEMKFASRKVKLGRVNIPLEAQTFAKKDSFDEKNIYMFKTLKLDDGESFGTLRYRMQGTSKRRKRLPNPRDRDCQLVYEHPNRWYLLIPYDKTEKVAPATFKDISLDPGTRKFQNVYSNDAKMVGLIDLPGRKENLQELLDKIRYHQRMSQVGHNSSYRKFHKNRFIMLWSKIKNKKRDLHAKTIRFLIDNFEEIRIGDFGAEFVKQNKLMNKKVKQDCSFLAHYEFRQRLLEHSATRTIVVVPESYTSRTCCRCGHVNNNLGSSETFKCPKCNFVSDRDSNGAVNMFIKDKSQ